MEGIVLVWVLSVPCEVRLHRTSQGLRPVMSKPSLGNKSWTRVVQFYLYTEVVGMFDETARPLLCACRCVHRRRRRSGPVLSRITRIRHCSVGAQ